MSLEVFSEKDAKFLARNIEEFEGGENEALENKTYEKLASIFELTNRRSLTEKPH